MRRRLSIRARLTLFCAYLAIFTGALGVVVTLGITRAGLRENARRTPLAPLAAGPAVAGPAVNEGIVRAPTNGAAAAPALGGLLPGAPPAGSALPGDPLGTVQGRIAEGGRVDTVIKESRGKGLLTVLGLAGLSLVAAWFVAGRMLRPVRLMTTAAHQVATPGAGRRIALVGPRDELHDLADTIDAMLDRLDASFEAQRRFVADASHELRTPLAVLRTEVDVALDDPGATTAELRSSLERVHGELQRTSHLVESLLHLSRAETLNTTTAHDLAASAEQAVAVARRLTVGLHDVHIEAALSSAPVLGDPLLLDRLVTNLVENAHRHNVDGGHVHVSTSSAAGISMLVVENDGPVLDAEQVAQLFERFRRGNSSRTARQRNDGHGLGLAIVKTIVTTHGGTIELHPRPGGGLRVEVRFPTSGHGTSPTDVR